MDTEVTTTTEHRTHGVVVRVNNQPVRFSLREVTGSQIKAEAIRQGVQIQESFALFKVNKHELKPIGDSEHVHLGEHDEFRAVAPDDNS